MNKEDNFIQSNVSLKRYTSWEVGGEAEYIALPKTKEEVQKAIEWARQNHQKISILGGGTNVLIADEGIKGLTICLRKLSGIKSEVKNGRIEIQVMAGCTKSELLKEFLRHKLAPALFLAGLPGDVGGGVVMNAGVSENIVPKEFVEIVDWVKVLREDQEHVFQKKDLSWSYRHCMEWQPGIILEVGISWPMKEEPNILQRVRDANKLRLQKQPLDQPSCGSVFINPPGQRAGKLIEDCGLKGFGIGGAEVSKKHANFIVNKGHATANDIKSLILFIQKTVKEKTGTELRTEVVFLS